MYKIHVKYITCWDVIEGVWNNTNNPSFGEDWERVMYIYY